MKWWALARRGPMLLPAVALYVGLWWLARNEFFGTTYGFTIMIGIAFAVVIATSLESREHDLERGTVRRVGVLDAGLVIVLSALACAGLAAIASLVVGGIADMVWATWFGAGFVALGAAFKRTAKSVGLVTLVYATLWAMRYIAGPSWSLIHPEAPPAVGWVSSVVALTLGVTALALTGSHRQPLSPRES